MQNRLTIQRFVLLLVVVLAASIVAQAQWKLLGPEGGDARSLAADPKNPDRVVLGTSAGRIFISENGGSSWSHWAHLGTHDDYVLDHIVFDPNDSNIVYVAAWSIEETNGDLFRTRDGGKTWQALPGVHGKSIRAFAIFPADPKIMVIAALDGVFRSRDAGETWDRITPEGHPDLRNFESIAIDRKNPDVIYAGTWHLPWKTNDGGTSWHNIKNGVIDDSDVFSIIIDHSNPATVFASACSGIYKSENAGELFHKIQGIPKTARRTRVLHQDPVNANVVYAGTTEGLWKTVDAGKTFKLISPPNYILNDVLVDPRNPSRVLIATDRGGVFSTNDGGLSFRPSNTGFSHRQITSVVADATATGTLWVSMVNDKEFGGVFKSRDNGESWTQVASGLEDRDVFDLAQAPSGALLAATNRGLYKFVPATSKWTPANVIVTQKVQALPPPRRVNGKVVQSKPLPPSWVKTEFDTRALGLALGDEKWFAATDTGVLSSIDEGKSWTRAAIPVAPNGLRFVAMTSSAGAAAAITPTQLVYSADGGATWEWKNVPQYVTRLFGVTLDGGTLWLSTREGALRSRDNGATWEHVLEGLPTRNVVSIRRSAGGVLLATTLRNTSVYLSRDHGLTWTETPHAHYRLQLAAISDGRLFAASAFNGLLASETGERGALISPAGSKVEVK